MTKNSFYTIIFMFVIALSGCQTIPMQNIESGYNNTSDMEMLELAEKIVSAGTDAGWKMTKKSVSRIEAMKANGKEKLIVHIKFSRNKFKTIYRDSENLGYDAKTMMISDTYNSWTKGLNDAIKSKIQ